MCRLRPVGAGRDVPAGSIPGEGVLGLDPLCGAAKCLLTGALPSPIARGSRTLLEGIQAMDRKPATRRTGILRRSPFREPRSEAERSRFEAHFNPLVTAPAEFQRAHTAPAGKCHPR